jgi:UDP-N-acetyl-2-amino-2-deoxyglucuronate dehydrogenase
LYHLSGQDIYLFGENGTVKIGGASTNTIEVWNFADAGTSDGENETLVEKTANIYGNGHSHLFADVIDAIVNDRQPYVDAHAGKKALEMVLAIYKSQKTGLPVTLPLDNFASTDMIQTF